MQNESTSERTQSASPEYSGPERRTDTDRRSGWDRRKSKANLGLLEMVTSHDVGGQCTKITSWLKRHYDIYGTGFLFQDSRSSPTYRYTETVSKDILQNWEEIFAKFDQDKKAENENMFFALKDGKMISFNPQEHHEASEPAALAIPLTLQNHSIGTMVLVTGSATIQRLASEKSAPFWFTPLISSLLDNSISHEQKDNKIRMLNLYQTVSSSLVYIGDLHELLTAIISIVTTELLCEEGSVLLYDEDNNEFEFFTAVGETGKELVKQRFPADKGVAGRALRERTTLVVGDVQTCPDFYSSIDEQFHFKTKSILAAPIVAGNEPVGVIEAINKTGNKCFEKEDEQILSAIADEVALAVKNAKLFDYVVDSYCKIRQGQHSCKDCKRPLKTWTPCALQLDLD